MNVYLVSGKGIDCRRIVFADSDEEAKTLFTEECNCDEATVELLDNNIDKIIHVDSIPRVVLVDTLPMLYLAIYIRAEREYSNF